jgi:peptidoglycan/LPS O-acetylase OafA/YrhL
LIPAESKPARKKLDSLTGLRFCAALFVVVYHVRDGFEGLPSPVRLFISRGYVAVPLFFALSGFVLAYTYAEHGRLRGTKGNFWLARFSRIYPIYFVAFLLFAPVAWVKVPSFLATAVSTVTLTQSWRGFSNGIPRVGRCPWKHFCI